MQEIKIDTVELEKVYRQKSNHDAAKHFKISPTTLTKILKEAGIAMKGRGGKKRVTLL